ncbi:hypothetical protein GCM10009863_19740 [Streptomyces axinellae]|uniref:Uncharacterized protein n=1 Tax=Streptomyces axinellae TaxID=552788 RepID=A0ABP6C7L2_9ACTN
MPHATGEELEFSGSEDEASPAEVEVLGAWEDFVHAAGRGDSGDSTERDARYDRLRSAMLGLRNSGARFWMAHGAFEEHVKAAQRRRELPEGWLPLPVPTEPDRLVGGVVITVEGRRGSALVEQASQTLRRNGGFASYPAPPSSGRSLAQAAREARVQGAGRRDGGRSAGAAGQQSQPPRERSFRQRSFGTGSSSERSASPRRS